LQSVYYCISSCFGAKKHCLVGDVDGIGTPVWAFACREGMTTHWERVIVMSTVVDPRPLTRTALCLYCHCAFKRNARRSMNPSCAARSPTPSRLASAGDLQATSALLSARLAAGRGTVAALVAEARCTGRQDRRALTHPWRHRRWGWVWERCWPSTLVTFLTPASVQKRLLAPPACFEGDQHN
jgi:hypothetical protein